MRTKSISKNETFQCGIKIDYNTKGKLSRELQKSATKNLAVISVFVSGRLLLKA